MADSISQILGGAYGGASDGVMDRLKRSADRTVSWVKENVLVFLVILALLAGAGVLLGLFLSKQEDADLCAADLAQANSTLQTMAASASTAAATAGQCQTDLVAAQSAVAAASTCRGELSAARKSADTASKALTASKADCRTRVAAAAADCSACPDAENKSRARSPSPSGVAPAVLPAVQRA